MARKIRCNDKVIVITGRDKGKTGIVTKVVSLHTVVVGGVNLVKKHQKSIPDKNQIGGIIKKELPIQVSNLKIINKNTEKPDRVGFRFEQNKKVRYYKSDNKVIK